MSNENKSVFRVIREKGVAKVAVALLAASLLAGIAWPPGPGAPGLAYPPGPSAPAALAFPPGPGIAYPPGPTAPAALAFPPGPTAPAKA
jgi:hypothetical protein